MAIEDPRQPENWDEVDPIHIQDVVALWHNINPNDIWKKRLASAEMEQTFLSLLRGK